MKQETLSSIELEIGRVYKSFNDHLIKVEAISSEGMTRLYDISDNNREWIPIERARAKLISLIR